MEYEVAMSATAMANGTASAKASIDPFLSISPTRIVPLKCHREATAGLFSSARLLLPCAIRGWTGAGFPERDQRFSATFAADPPPGGPRKTARVKSRDEHLTWAKRRALVCVDRGDFARAVTGLRADLAEHPLTKGVVSSGQALRGFKAAIDAALGRGSQALT